MAKKNEGKNLDQLVNDLISNVGEDRDRLVSFLEDLISSYSGDKSVGIAEYVAKLADALTRQNQVKVATLKALSKSQSSTKNDDSNSIYDEIGLPFSDSEVDGGN